MEEKRDAYDTLNDDVKKKPLNYMKRKNKKEDIILNPALMYLPEDAVYEKKHDNVKK